MFWWSRTATGPLICCLPVRRALHVNPIVVVRQN